MSESPLPSVEHLPLAVVVHVLAADFRKNEVDALCSAVDNARLVAPSLPFILDLAKVRFAASLALGTLVGLTKEFGFRKQQLILVNLQNDLRQAVELSRLDRILEIMQDVPVALERLGVDGASKSG